MSLLQLGNPSFMISMRFCMRRSRFVASRSLYHVMASNVSKLRLQAALRSDLVRHRLIHLLFQDFSECLHIHGSLLLNRNCLVLADLSNILM